MEQDAEPGIVFGLGGKFDKSFNESAYLGAEAWAAATGQPYRSFELIAEAQMETVLLRFAEDGNSPVVAIGFSFQAAVEGAAEFFPDTPFAIIGGTSSGANVGSYNFAHEDGAYVMGAIAAAASSTGTIGFIGGMDSPFSREYESSFRAGATETRPDIELLVNYSGTTAAAWIDPVRGAELANAQIALGADVIYSPANVTSNGVFQAIADANASSDTPLYGIGSDSNVNYLHPGVMLTSLVHEVGVAVGMIFEDGIRPGETILSFAEGGLSYAVDENNADILTPDLRAVADSAIAYVSSLDGGGGAGSDTPTGGNDVIGGTEDAETIDALGGDDRISGNGGDDIIDGGAGVDTALFSGAQGNYTLRIDGETLTVIDRRADGTGTDTLSNVEFLDFATNTLGAPLDVARFGGFGGLSAEDAESFIELYIAYFNRAPDALGLNFWGTAFANGTSLEAMAGLFVDQDETRATYPDGTSNGDFAASVYSNVLGRVPDQAGIDFWTGLLDSGAVSRDQFILEVLRGAKSPLKPELGQDFVDQQIADRDYLEAKTDIGAYFAVKEGISDVSFAVLAMGIFDGSSESVAAATAAIDDFADVNSGPGGEAFVMEVIGVIDALFPDG